MQIGITDMKEAAASANVGFSPTHSAGTRNKKTSEVQKSYHKVLHFGITKAMYGIERMTRGIHSERKNNLRSEEEEYA